MKKLEPPDIHYLRAAEGWLGFGDLASADAELEQITLAHQSHPDVLVARSDILAEGKKWDALLPVTETLFKTVPEDPDSWLQRSFVLHQMRRTQEAFDLMLPAVEKFPKNWIVTYNLACYTAQLGRLTEAWKWLGWTSKLRDSQKLKSTALEDPDLEPLWPIIARIPTNPPQTSVASEPYWPCLDLVDKRN